MVDQLTFELGLPAPTFSREDFVVSDSNREALAWIDRWPDWPAPALALNGPSGCGKTHLGRIWAARANAAVMDGADLEGKSVPDLTALASSSAAIVIDHAERAPERGLFHLYNLMRERGRHLLLISEAPPASAIATAAHRRTGSSRRRACARRPRSPSPRPTTSCWARSS